MLAIMRSSGGLPARAVAVAAVLAAGIMISACGERTSGSSGNGKSSAATNTGTQIEGPAPAPPDWDNPTGDPAVATVQDVQTAMPMAIVVPQDLSGLISAHVSPADRPPADRVASFVYDDPNYGRVVVEETSPQETPTQWLSAAKSYVSELNQAKSNPDSTVVAMGNASLVDVRGSTEALATTGDWGDMQWLEGPSLEIHILGPKLNDVDQLQDIANNLGDPAS